MEPLSQDELHSTSTSPVEICPDNEYLEIPQEGIGHEKSKSWDSQTKAAVAVSQAILLRSENPPSKTILSKSAEVVKTTSIPDQQAVINIEIDDEEEEDEEDFVGHRFESPYIVPSKRENVRDSLAIELNEDDQVDIAVGTMVVTQLSQLDWEDESGSPKSSTTKSLNSSASHSMKSTFAVGSIPRRSKKSFKQVE